MTLLDEFFAGRRAIEAEAHRDEIARVKEDADLAYKRLALLAADLLGAAQASGAGAIFEEAAHRGLYG